MHFHSDPAKVIEKNAARSALTNCNMLTKPPPTSKTTRIVTLNLSSWWVPLSDWVHFSTVASRGTS